MRLTLKKSVSDIDRRRRRRVQGKYGQYVRCCLVSSLLIFLSVLYYVMPAPILYATPPAQPDAPKATPSILLTDMEKEWILSHPVITFSVDDNYAPKSFRNKDNRMVGIDIDYAELLARRVGLRIRFEGSTGSQALARGINHEVDGVINVAMPTDPTPSLLFSEVYASYPQALAVRKEERPIENLAAFANKTVATPKDSPQLMLLHKEYPEMKIVPVVTMEEALNLLMNNKVDGVYDDLAVLHNTISRLSPGNVRFGAIHEEPATGHARIGINSAEPELLSLFNKAIASLTDNDKCRIHDTWIKIELPESSDKPKTSPLNLTESESRWLHEHPVIRVAAASDHAPLAFRDEKGEYQGLVLDYLTQIGEMLHVRFDVVRDRTEDELIGMGMRREVDLFPGIIPTPNRETYLLFTEPYLSLPIAVFFHQDNSPAVQNLQDLLGKQLVTVSECQPLDWMTRDYPGVKQVPVSSIEQGLIDLHARKTDAFVNDLYSTGYYLGELGYHDIKVAGLTPYSFNISMGVRSDWPELKRILDKALRAIPEEELNLFKTQWFAVQPPNTKNYSLLWKIALAGLAILGALLARNYRLRREITHRTRDLSRANENLRMEIATRKQVESDGLRLEEQLTQAQKMESIGRLAGGVAHDFNNILAVILGHTELMIEDCPADSTLQESLEEIMAAGTRAQDLTRQLLAFSRKQVLEVKILDLNQVVRGMEKMIRRLLGEDITVNLHLNAGTSLVKADMSQLEQVLLNLCINARDAMPDGGAITIETSMAPPHDQFILSQSDTQPVTFVLLAVSDTGTGMDESIKSQIFDPFFTTKEKGKGTGLGLSTVYGIVKQHGGDISVHSESGRGATFRVYLPLAQEALSEQDAELLDNALRGHGETVLVAEDEVAVRKMVCQMLSRLGYSVIETGSVDECIAYATKTDQIHLLLADVIMPDMNGRQLHEHIQTLHPAMKTLFMSGYTDDVIRHHGMLKEDVQFISKPFTEKTLGRKLRAALDAEVCFVSSGDGPSE